MRSGAGLRGVPPVGRLVFTAGEAPRPADPGRRRSMPTTVVLCPWYCRYRGGAAVTTQCGDTCEYPPSWAAFEKYRYIHGSILLAAVVGPGGRVERGLLLELVDVEGGVFMPFTRISAAPHRHR